MANITPTYNPNTSVLIVRPSWGPMLNGDVGIAFTNDLAVFGDRSVQVLGTFGAGGTMVIEGSNDGGTTWAPLTDAFGNSLGSITSAKIAQITEAVDRIRPRVAAGDGTTSLSVYMFAKKVVV